MLGQQAVLDHSGVVGGGKRREKKKRGRKKERKMGEEKKRKTEGKQRGKGKDTTSSGKVITPYQKKKTHFTFFFLM